MSNRLAMSLSAGILAFVWILVSTAVGIPAWVGFAGCCSFFAAGMGKDGAIKSVAANMTGVLWATGALTVSALIPLPQMGAVTAGVISFFMCWQSEQKWLSYIPSAFIGCFVTYGLNGDTTTAITGLLMGAVYGICCEALTVLFLRWGKTAKAQPQR